MSLSSFQLTEARRNKLLMALPEYDWMRVQRYLEPMTLHAGQIISASGAQLRHAYLPTTATVSLIYVTLDGESSEIASVGNEGLVGIPLYMGGEVMTACAVVQGAGGAFRLAGDELKAEFRRGGATQRLLLLYAQARLGQVAQTAVCNGLHSVEQRLCRWLLSNLDRSVTGELAVTHELISKSLSVRREGITEAAGRLQRSGIIASSRGRVAVVDRRGLEASCCECYRVMHQEYDRLLGSACSQDRIPQRIGCGASLRTSAITPRDASVLFA